MKRGGPSHPKTFVLAEALGIRRAHAVGILELLFHFTAQYCPTGDVGKFEDKRLAAALDWGSSPAKLVDSLVSAGWLDRHPTARLVVHDWAEHADRAVAQRMKRLGKSMVQPNEEIAGKVCTQVDTPRERKSALPEPEPEPEPEPHSRAFAPPNGNSRALKKPDRNSFEEFRAEYPPPKNGTCLDQACRAYMSVIDGKPGEHDRLMAGLARYKSSAEWQRSLSEDGGRFIPSMVTFISDRRYVDTPSAADEAPEVSRRAPSIASGLRWDPITEEYLPAEGVQ